MALEALSRGAGTAVLVDLDPAAASSNVESLRLQHRAEVLGRSVATALEAIDTHEFDLIFCDPPYRLAATEMEPLGPKILAAASPEGRIVVEGPAGEGPFLEAPVLFDRTYGRARVMIHGVRA